MTRRIPLGHVAKTAFTQSLRRIASDLGGPARSLKTIKPNKIDVFHTIDLGKPYGNAATGKALISGHFVFARQHLDVGAQGDPWSIASPSERFAFWLHSFDWLADLSAAKQKAGPVRARTLIDRWIEIYGGWNPYAWDNDILANRLFAWLSVWSDLLVDDSLSSAALNRRASTLKQLKHLRRTYKRTPPGLPRLKASATIALGGLYLKEKHEEFLDRGLDWLNDEIDEQILPDGGHVSRSPTQCLDALNVLTTLDRALEKRGIEGSKILQRAIDRLHHIIPFFKATDGGLACFQSSGENDKKKIAHILKRSGREAKPFVYCPHTGYQRIELGGSVMIVDTGPTSPRPYDLNAHLSPLAFELSTTGGRLIVNCGWSREQPQNWEDMMRDTAAHSTLILNKRSAGQILEDGFASKVLGKAVSKGVETVNAARKDQAEGVWLETSHDGYQDETGLYHRRQLYMKSDGLDIRGEDGLLVPIGHVPLSRDEIDFDLRFHLHPSVRATLAQDMHSALLIQPGNLGWRFRTDSGPIRIADSVYLGAGDKPVKSQQIVISGRAVADSDGEVRSNRVRWSLKCLEAHK